MNALVNTLKKHGNFKLAEMAEEQAAQLESVTKEHNDYKTRVEAEHAELVKRLEAYELALISVKYKLATIKHSTDAALEFIATADGAG